MLEHIDFDENETHEIIKYYRVVLFIFQDCLIETVKNIDEKYLPFKEKLKDIITKVEEIEFLDEVEIISDKFNEFTEKFKYKIIDDCIRSGDKFDIFNNFYLLVQANALKNILMFALEQSWKNKVQKKEIIYLNDFIKILNDYILTTSKDIINDNFKHNFFDGDTLYFLKMISNKKYTNDDIILFTDKIIESCDGDNLNNNYNVIDESVNNINDSLHSEYQQNINKILAINIYAICIEELFKTMS